MAKKKLEKKTIVTANLGGLTGSEFVDKTGGMVKSMKDNPDKVPGIKPTVEEANEEVTALKGLYEERDEIEKTYKSKTSEINQQQEKVNDMIVNDWVPMVQKACGNDHKTIILLGYGIKGVVNGKSEETKGKAMDTHPVIISIDTKVNFQQTIHVINSETKSIKMPKDAESINIYEQIGGATPPTSIKSMNFIGIVKNGKFINHFEVADIGKAVYYIVVYTDKKTGKTLEMSPVAIAIIG